MGPVATVALAVAAEVPDVDAVLRLFDHTQTLYLAHHRGLTHSLIGAPLLAALVATACLPWSRDRRFAPLFGLSLLGVLVHIAEDVVTPFGTMLFAPLSWHRYALDWFFIIDPYFSGLLLAALALAWTWRRRPLRGAIAARVGVCTLGAYLGLTGVLHAMALGRVERLAAERGWAISAAAAFPRPGSPLWWNGVVATPEASYQVWFSLLDDRMPAERSYPTVSLDGALRAAEETPIVDFFRGFARFPVMEVHNGGEGTVVEMYDLRFRYRWRDTPFRVRIHLNGEGEVLKSGWGG
jgi:inner membrane protein